MNVVVRVPKGGERVAVEEVKELVGLEATPHEGEIRFKTAQKDQLFEYCYFSQAALQVLLDITISEWLLPGMSFRVRAESQEKEREEGARINKEGKFIVDLENPEIPLVLYRDNLYLDFSGDVSKRDFRVFTHRQTFKGPAAFCFLKIAGYTGKESLIDPFARDGTILLEAVHYTLKKSVRTYDWEKMYFTKFKAFSSFDFETFFSQFPEKEVKPRITGWNAEFRDVQAAKKNAKIANVTLDVRRVDVDWLDVKYRPGEVDLLVSYPPKLSEKDMQEFLKLAKRTAEKTVLLLDTSAEGVPLQLGKETKHVWTLKA